MISTSEYKYPLILKHQQQLVTDIFYHDKQHNVITITSYRYSDKILANILTTKTGLCDRRFELTIDDVKFVGHPTLVQDVNTKWVRC